MDKTHTYAEYAESRFGIGTAYSAYVVHPEADEEFAEAVGYYSEISLELGAVIFLDNPGYVWIVAVMHVRRRPGYWRARLGHRQ
jgi:hypothetical protein